MTNNKCNQAKQLLDKLEEATDVDYNGLTREEVITIIAEAL